METTTVIDYVHDPLYRLTGAKYDSAAFFDRTYDAAGNRLSETTQAGNTTYAYDHANRLVEIVQGGDTYEYQYNGLGDRLEQTVNGDATAYTLDLAVGLTPVLAAGHDLTPYGFRAALQRA